MKRNNTRRQALYGICRIDSDRDRTHAWRVSLRRRGKVYVKNFADRKCGGKQAALAQAKAHRDRLVEQHPPLSRQEFCSVLRSNNNTGITGVYRYSKSYTLKNGEIVRSWYWEATWPIGKSKQAHQAFSVNEHGEAEARRLAIRTRKQALKALDGVFWACARGAMR
jgi:hypothetical protein